MFLQSSTGRLKAWPGPGRPGRVLAHHIHTFEDAAHQARHDLRVVAVEVVAHGHTSAIKWLAVPVVTTRREPFSLSVTL